MPGNYNSLVPFAWSEEFCFQKNINNNALFNPASEEYAILCRLIAREKAKSNPPLIIPYIEITTSPQCTLKCMDCANLMQYYVNPPRMNIGMTLKTISAFFDAVDYIIMFRIMGGEPLLDKDIDIIIDFVLRSSKVQHMEIVTNGTIVPREDTFSLLQNSKASVFISNYGEHSPLREEILHLCAERGINTRTTETLSDWVDMGKVVKRNSSPGALETAYRTCDSMCRHLWNGEFHMCPRSAHGTFLGLIEKRAEDYVDLLNNSAEENKRQIRLLYDTPYIAACDYCVPLHERTSIPPARQR